MPQITVSFHELAAKEFRAARRWYRKRTPAAAERFRDAMDQVVDHPKTTPERGIPFRVRFRWMRTKRFPYLIYYEIRDSEHVVVYAVAHARRRLGYWVRRVRG